MEFFTGLLVGIILGAFGIIVIAVNCSGKDS